MFGQQLRLLNNRLGDPIGERRIFTLQESRKSIEVGERVVRPFDSHRSRQDRKADVPHVRSQRTTSALGTVARPSSTAFQRRSNSAILPDSTETGSLSKLTSSATNCETLIPRSDASVLSAAAVVSSTSIVCIIATRSLEPPARAP